MLLPARMKGKLEPEEWKPLIVSELIFRYQLGKERSRYLGKRFLVGLIPVSIADFQIYRTVNQYDPSLIFTAIVVIASIVSLLALVVYISRPYLNKLRLVADKRAAEIVTREEFLRVLTKIRTLEPDSVRITEDRGCGKQHRVKPSLIDRIANLSSAGGLNQSPDNKQLPLGS